MSHYQRVQWKLTVSEAEQIYYCIIHNTTNLPQIQMTQLYADDILFYIANS